MKSVSRLFRPQTNILKSVSAFRSQNEWESGIGRYNVPDEHEPPKQEEILSKL